ncbi:frataxin, mitochondrial-like [Argonauta hians]
MLMRRLPLKLFRYLPRNTHVFHYNRAITYLYFKAYGLTYLKKLQFSKLPASCLLYCTDVTNSLGENEYVRIADETLESLLDSIESLEELENCPKGFDTSYSNGVLTVCLGDLGTYVINKQSPNRQIWLSSPISGPKRYDFVGNKWIYKRDGTSLHGLLQEEISLIMKEDICFTDCSFC